jgi:hypothetical protein
MADGSGVWVQAKLKSWLRANPKGGDCIELFLGPRLRTALGVLCVGQAKLLSLSRELLSGGGSTWSTARARC